MTVPEPSHEELDQRVSELSRLLLAEETLETSLRRTAELAVALIPHCDTCGVSVAEDGRVSTRVSTSALAERVDAYQYAIDEGPCLEAFRTGTVIKVTSLAAERRWPRFTARATQAGLTSSCSVPLVIHDQRVGALNLYSLTRAFDDADDVAVASFAQQAAVTLANAQTYQHARELVEHLSVAIETRDVIGQAKGIIMERERCTAQQAFEILRSGSQTRNIKLRAFAQKVVDTGIWRE